MKGAIIMDITTIKYPSHNDLVQWYYQLAQSIAEAAGVTPEDVNTLIAAYIEDHPYPVVPTDIITASNAAQNVVTSINGEKGDVTVTGGGDVPENVITTDNIEDNAVTSFNGQKGDINYTAPVTSVNGRMGDVVNLCNATISTGEQYGERVILDNGSGFTLSYSRDGRLMIYEKNVGPKNVFYGDNSQPPYPVTSVNDKTGNVTVRESPENVITDSNISTKAVTSFNGQVGAVSAAVPVITDIESTTDVTDGFIVDFGAHGYMVIKTVSMLVTSSGRPAYAVNLPSEYTHGVNYVITGFPLDASVHFTIKATTFTPGQNVIRTFVDAVDQANPSTARFCYILYW